MVGGPIASGVPAPVDRAFQVVEAWASGDLERLAGLSTERLARQLRDDGAVRRQWLDPAGWRGAASLWVASSDRTVLARTDDATSWVSFREEGPDRFVLVFVHEGGLPRLDGARRIPRVDHDAFGRIV